MSWPSAHQVCLQPNAAAPSEVLKYFRMLLTSDGKLELEMDKLIGEAYAWSPRKKRKWRDKCVLQLLPDFGKWK